MVLEREFISPKTFVCMGFAANSLTFKTPSQFFTGCGSFHLRSPTGGAAKGIPLKDLIPLFSRIPSTKPLAVFTSKPLEGEDFTVDFLFCAITGTII
jgi:hypothetical protein